MPREAFAAIGPDGIALAFHALAGAAVAGVGVRRIDEAVAAARPTPHARHRIAEETGLTSA